MRRDDAVRGLTRRDASETRRRIRRRSIAPWIDRQPAGAATRRTGPDATDRRIRRELIRVTNAPDLAKQGWRPNAVEVSGSGLRPEGVLVYDERSQGRVAGPTAKVSQPRQIGRTMVSHETPPTLLLRRDFTPRRRPGSAYRPCASLPWSRRSPAGTRREGERHSSHLGRGHRYASVRPLSLKH